MIKNITVLEILIIGAIILIFVAIIIGPVGCSVFPYGPQRQLNATVKSKHIDNLGEAGSAYLITTDQGVFEVENSYFMSPPIYNADEIYGNLNPGNTYTITTKGEKVLGIFFQEYPRIISYKLIEEKE